jgi:hypothetical protein
MVIELPASDNSRLYTMIFAVLQFYYQDFDDAVRTDVATITNGIVTAYESGQRHYATAA